MVCVAELNNSRIRAGDRLVQRQCHYEAAGVSHTGEEFSLRRIQLGQDRGGLSSRDGNHHRVGAFHPLGPLGAVRSVPCDGRTAGIRFDLSDLGQEFDL
jgi:hypothetical protein